VLVIKTLLGESFDQTINHSGVNMNSFFPIFRLIFCAGVISFLTAGSSAQADESLTLQQHLNHKCHKKSKCCCCPGPTGPTGPCCPGPTGPTGATGATGATGPTGCCSSIFVSSYSEQCYKQCVKSCKTEDVTFHCNLLERGIDHYPGDAVFFLPEPGAYSVHWTITVHGDYCRDGKINVILDVNGCTFDLAATAICEDCPLVTASGEFALPIEHCDSELKLQVHVSGGDAVLLQRNIFIQKICH